MPRTEAQKRAQKKYRQKADKYEKIKEINARSNRKRYHEDPELRQRKINQMKEYNLAKKMKQEEVDKYNEILDTITEQQTDTWRQIEVSDDE